jgi:hypothetical protein
LLAQATSRRSIDDGLALAFASGPDIAAEIARLSAAEVACCSWIDFTVRPMVDSTILEVRAAAAAQESLVALFGAG